MLALLENSKTEEPTLIELTAIGSILHSFYNGIENIFKAIGKNIDAEIPNGKHDLIIIVGHAYHFSESNLESIRTSRCSRMFVFSRPGASL